MSIKVTGDAMIFSKEYEGRTFYSLGVSTKNQDGSYTNGYLDVQFKKGVELENKTKIDIKDSWFKCYKTKDGKSKVYLFVNEFDGETKKDIPSGFAEVDDDFSPF